MPQPRKRSRTLRRVKRKLPGNRVTVHYKLRKPKAHKCGACGRVLPGTVRERPAELRSVPKTRKRPERPYGGVLCSRCTRAKIKEMARA